MYNAFFEFEENPFSPKPDLAFFYRSKQHDTSLRSLLFTVQSRMGLSSLTGEEGTGKTMLLECLRDTLESTQIQCAFLRDPRISANRFFQTIASELDLKCQGTSAYQVFAALHQFTLQQAKKGRTVALIVDDAHNLPADVLNEILHLASLHDDKVKLLQTVLAGRPQLLPTLDALNLERLKQHAVLSCHLDPFTAEETQNYIEFRLAQAGLPEQTIFPPDALSEIYLRSRGFAPAIHAICEGLLLAAFSAGTKVCTPEILDQVFSRTARGRTPGRGGHQDRSCPLAAPEPEPPALLTALLQLTFAAIKTSAAAASGERERRAGASARRSPADVRHAGTLRFLSEISQWVRSSRCGSPTARETYPAVLDRFSPRSSRFPPRGCHFETGLIQTRRFGRAASCEQTATNPSKHSSRRPSEQGCAHRVPFRRSRDADRLRKCRAATCKFRHRESQSSRGAAYAKGREQARPPFVRGQAELWNPHSGVRRGKRSGCPGDIRTRTSYC